MLRVAPTYKTVSFEPVVLYCTVYARHLASTCLRPKLALAHSRLIRGGSIDSNFGERDPLILTSIVTLSNILLCNIRTPEESQNAN